MLTKITDDIWIDIYDIVLIKFDDNVIKLVLRNIPDLFEIECAPDVEKSLKEAFNDFYRPSIAAMAN